LRCGALGCAPVLHLKIVEQILVAQKIGKADCVTDLDAATATPARSFQFEFGRLSRH